MSKLPKKSAKSAKTHIKAINIRMSYDMWYFIKQRCIEQETSFNEIVNQQLTKFKEKFDK